jgi:hypothetical protein
MIVVTFKPSVNCEYSCILHPSVPESPIPRHFLQFPPAPDPAQIYVLDLSRGGCIFEPHAVMREKRNTDCNLPLQDRRAKRLPSCTLVSFVVLPLSTQSTYMQNLAHTRPQPPLTRIPAPPTFGPPIAPTLLNPALDAAHTQSQLPRKRID